MRIWLILAMVLLMTTEAANAYTKSGSTRDGVIAVLTAQSVAWNKGDLTDFLKGYLDSEDISFVSGGTELRGLKALRERYEKRYGKSRETMGKLDFHDLEVKELGPKNAMCIGHWHVDRPHESALGGMFTLILVRTSSGWRIIHDHTSVADK